MKSYSSLRVGFFSRLSEMWHLYVMNRDRAANIEPFLERMNEITARVKAVSQKEVCDLDVLDVGCGQQLKQAKLFALQNRVTAIDQSYIPTNLLGYLRLARTNGLMRAIKTFFRRALGIDGQLNRSLMAKYPTHRPNPITVRQMDASDLEFPAETFDFIYSFSVFEHLSDPASVLKEMKRVLRTGGVLCIGVHLYTSDGGCHDPRILSGNRGDLPRWPHLRRGIKERVEPNSYLNEWRLQEYRSMFEAALPGAELHCFQRASKALAPDLEAVRESGELDEFSDDELLTDEFLAIWKKVPSA